MRAILEGLCLVAAAAIAQAQLPTGTWVKRGGDGGRLAMTIEHAGTGFRLTYRIIGDDGRPTGQMLLTLTTQLDGKDAPVMSNGKPTGETMAIRRVDDAHTQTFLKVNGEPFGTSKSELSRDGKRIKVENTYTRNALGQAPGTVVEYWEKR